MSKYKCVKQYDITDCGPHVLQLSACNIKNRLQ